MLIYFEGTCEAKNQSQTWINKHRHSKSIQNNRRKCMVILNRLNSLRRLLLSVLLFLLLLFSYLVHPFRILFVHSLICRKPSLDTVHRCCSLCFCCDHRDWIHYLQKENW